MALSSRLLNRRILPCYRLLAAPQARLYSTGTVSNQPGSENFKEMKENAKEEMGTIVKDVAGAIAGANARTSQVGSSKSAMQSIGSDVSGITEIVQDVPKGAMMFGAAGLFPYLGTSITAVYLSHQAALAQNSKTTSAIDADTALALLHHVENVQIGYGAVVLSFIGAIHWGLEFAGFGGKQGTSRYVLGLFPVMIAMPTLLLPNQIALISQWAAFASTWWLDQRATTMGWAPRWYSTYRFWLTAIVGSSILISLGGSNYFGPGANIATTAHRLDEANRKAAEEMVNQDPQRGRVVTGKIDGDVEAKPAQDAFVKLTNVPRQKEEEEKKAKEEAEKKAKAKEDAKKKESGDKKQESGEKEKKDSGNKTPGA